MGEEASARGRPSSEKDNACRHNDGKAGENRGDNPEQMSAKEVGWNLVGTEAVDMTSELTSSRCSTVVDSQSDFGLSDGASKTITSFVDEHKGGDGETELNRTNDANPSVTEEKEQAEEMLDRVEETRGRVNRKTQRRRSRSQTPFTRQKVDIDDSIEDDSDQELGVDAHGEEMDPKQGEKHVSFHLRVESQENEEISGEKADSQTQCKANNSSFVTDQQSPASDGNPQSGRDSLVQRLSTDAEETDDAPRSARSTRRRNRRRSATPFHRESLSSKKNSSDEVASLEGSYAPVSDEQRMEKAVNLSNSAESRKVRFSGEDNDSKVDEEDHLKPQAKKMPSSVTFSKQMSSGMHTSGKQSHDTHVRKFMSTVTSDGEGDRDESGIHELETQASTSSSVSFALEPQIITTSNGHDAAHAVHRLENKVTTGADSLPPVSPRGRQSMAGFKISKRDKTPFTRLVLNFNDPTYDEEKSPTHGQISPSVYKKSSPRSGSERSPRGSASPTFKMKASSDRGSCDDVIDCRGSPRGRQRSAASPRTKRDQTPFNPQSFETPSSDEEDMAAAVKATSCSKANSVVRFADGDEQMPSNMKSCPRVYGTRGQHGDSKETRSSRCRPVTPRARIRARSATPFSPRGNKNSVSWAVSDSDESSAENGPEETLTSCSSLREAASVNLEDEVQDQAQKTSATQDLGLEKPSQTTAGEASSEKSEKGTETNIPVKVEFTENESGDCELCKRLVSERCAWSRQRIWVPALVLGVAHVIAVGTMVIGLRSRK